jgi:L-fuconolactonase
MVTETENFSFADKDFEPFMDHVFNSFGSNRLLFGSDWPVCLLATNYKKVVTLINNYLDLHSAEIKAQVMGINATKIYNL